MDMSAVIKFKPFLKVPEKNRIVGSGLKLIGTIYPKISVNRTKGRKSSG
jgi:hypothetical protein